VVGFSIAFVQYLGLDDIGTNNFENEMESSFVVGEERNPIK